MLKRDDLWLVEEPPIDDSVDPLTIPEIKQYVAHELNDDELGLRTLLLCPEALSPALWSTRHATSRAAKRPPNALRAAFDARLPSAP